MARPSEEHLIEWSFAKRGNDGFRQGVEEQLGTAIWDALAYYGALGSKDRKAYKENTPIIDAYFEMKDFYAVDNQVWAKYYHINRYEGGQGIVGQGAEGRENFEPFEESSGFKRFKNSSFTGVSDRFQRKDDAFLPQGYPSGRLKW